MSNRPKPSDEPFYGLQSGFEEYFRSNKTQKALKSDIKLLILDLGHLRSVCMLALLAEKGLREHKVSCIEAAEILKALEANLVDRIKILVCCKDCVEDQRLRMGFFLCLEV